MILSLSHRIRMMMMMTMIDGWYLVMQELQCVGVSSMETQIFPVDLVYLSLGWGKGGPRQHVQGIVGKRSCILKK